MPETFPESIASLITDDPELVRHRYWASVWRAPTFQGDVYVKQCGPGGLFEPKLVETLAAAAPELIPEIVYAQDECLVTRSAGTVLHESTFDRIETMLRLQKPYADLQRSLIDAPELTATGTPVISNSDIPGLVRSLVDACFDEYSSVKKPLTDEEAEAALAAIPQLEAAGARLDELGIGITVQHDDFHGGNIVVSDDEHARMIDWGDSSIAHPFTHLTVLIRGLAYVLECEPDDPRILRVRDEYLDAWSDVADHARLVEAAADAQFVGYVLRCECWRRALAGGKGTNDWEEFAPSIPDWLRQLSEVRISRGI